MNSFIPRNIPRSENFLFISPHICSSFHWPSKKVGNFNWLVQLQLMVSSVTGEDWYVLYQLTASQPWSSVLSSLSYSEQASLFCRLPKTVAEQVFSFSLAMLLVISALMHLHVLAHLGLQYTSSRTE